MSKTKLNVVLKWLTSLCILAYSLSAFAINGRTTYQARIVKPNGYPLESASVNFRFSVLDQSGSCVLYIEDYAAINMTDTGGVISFPLGTGTRAFPTSGTTQTFQNTFDNSIPSFACQTMGIYNPNPTDARKVVMQFNDGIGGWQTLPAMTMNAVPYAMFATKAVNSQSLNGKADSAFVEYATLNGLGCAADQAIKYNGVSFSCLTVGGSATVVTSSTVIAALGYTPALGTSFTALDSAISTVSSTVYSVSSTVSNLDNLVTSLSNSVAASFSAITSSQWSTSGTDIYYDSNKVSIGTSATPSASYTLLVSGGIQVIGAESGISIPSNNVSVNFRQSQLNSWPASNTGFEFSTGSGVVRKFYFYNRSTSAGVQVLVDGAIGVGTTTPVTKLDVSGGVRVSMESGTCNTSLAGTIRYNTGSLEYCNGTSWATLGVAGSGITSLNSSTSGTQIFATGITGTVFNISSANGVHTFNLPLAASGSVIAGLLSNSDYVAFTNKVSATSASVISALGYTPASLTALTALESSVTSLSNTTAASFAAITNSQWVTSGSAISYSDGNVGIGTVNPEEKVHISNGWLLLDNSYGVRIKSASGAVTNAMRTGANDQLVIGSGGWNSISFHTGTSDKMFIASSGAVGIGTVVPTAKLQLGAGTSSIAPLKITSGTLVTSPQAGAVEYDGFNFYVTDGSNTRRAIAMSAQAGTLESVSNISSTGNLFLSPTGSVVVSSTTTSTSSNTGSLIVNGGLGVGENLNVSGIISGSSIIKATGYRANQGAPNNVDSSVNGYSFGEDGDTGIFSPGSMNAANGIVAIFNNNAETMRITSAGVGIGETNPLAKLQFGLSDWIGFHPQQGTTGIYFNEVGAMSVSGLSTTHGARLFYDGTSDLLRLTTIEGSVELPALNIARTTGFVGIGTTTPISPLEVSGVTYASSFGFNRIASSPGNGIYAPEGNSLAISTNSIERLKVNGLGLMGIGTSDPQRRLHVAGTGSSDGLLLDNGTIDSSNLIFHDSSQGIGGQTWNMDSSNGTFRLFTEPVTATSPLTAGSGLERMVISSGGNVGIGTTAPTDKLQVAGTITAANTSATAKITLTPDFSDSGFIQSYSGPGVFRPLAIEGKLITLNGQGSGTTLVGGNTKVVNTQQNNLTTYGSEVFALTLEQRYGSGGWGPALEFRTNDATHTWTNAAIATKDPLDGSYSGEMAFFTTAGGGVASASQGRTKITNLVERMRISNYGHVGIGTSSPSVVGTYNHVPSTKLLNLSNNGHTVFNVTGTSADLSLYDNNGTVDNRWHIIRNDSDKLQFVPHSDIGISKGAALTILNSNGIVGIGTTNPTARLHVEGGEILVNSDSTIGILGGLSLAGKDSDSGTPNMNRWSMYTMSDYGGASGLAFYEYYDADNDGALCDDGGTCAQRFIIAKGGNVGIGTTSAPTHKLEVRGGDTFMEGKAYVYSNSGWGSTVPAISLAIGDTDTGINWVSDGVMQLYSNNAPRMHITAGAIGVHRADPTYSLDVAGTFRVTGQAYTDTGAATFTVLSDVRYKDVHGPYERGLDDLLKIGTIRYNYKKVNPTGADSTHEYVGVSAQNVKEAIPEAVESQTKDGKDFLTVNPSSIIFAMINGFRDMYSLVMGHDREIASLKAKNQELENKLQEFDELKAYICKKDPQAPNCK